MSPRPLTLLPVGESAGIQTTGRIVRVMTFHSLSTWSGMTGWMFRMSCVPVSGP